MFLDWLLRAECYTREHGSRPSLGSSTIKRSNFHGHYSVSSDTSTNKIFMNYLFFLILAMTYPSSRGQSNDNWFMKKMFIFIFRKQCYEERDYVGQLMQWVTFSLSLLPYFSIEPTLSLQIFGINQWRQLNYVCEFHRNNSFFVKEYDLYLIKRIRSCKCVASGNQFYNKNVTLLVDNDRWTAFETSFCFW